MPFWSISQSLKAESYWDSQKKKFLIIMIYYLLCTLINIWTIKVNIYLRGSKPCMAEIEIAIPRSYQLVTCWRHRRGNKRKKKKKNFKINRTRSASMQIVQVGLQMQCRWADSSGCDSLLSLVTPVSVLRSSLSRCNTAHLILSDCQGQVAHFGESDTEYNTIPVWICLYTFVVSVFGNNFQIQIQSA